LALGKEAAQDAVDETGRTVAAEGLGKLDGLIGDGLGRGVGGEGDFVDGQAEDISVYGRELGDGPVGGERLNNAVKCGNLIEDAYGEFGAKAPGVRRSVISFFGALEDSADVVSGGVHFVESLQGEDPAFSPGAGHNKRLSRS